MSNHYNEHEQNAVYIFIPGGKYTYSVTKQDVEIPPMYFAKYPVTNELYRRFIAFLEDGERAAEISSRNLSLAVFASSLLNKAKETAGFAEYLGEDSMQWASKLRSSYDDDKRFNDDEQPVVGVSWFAATAYCHWLSELQRATSKQQSATNLFRLPTEVEWEWAATGGVREFPWGNEPPDDKRANYANKVGQTTPVGAYYQGSTPEGLMDMAGNVWEWNENLFGHEKYKEARDLRGGSWDYTAEFLRGVARSYDDPGNYWYADIGFRVACASSPNLLRL